MATSDEVPVIVAAVRRVIGRPPADVGHAVELSPLLAATQSRAVGCWRHADGELHLAAFLAVDDMSAAVQSEFVAVTRRVSLSQTQFGIIQAVMQRGPAVNHRAVAPKSSAEGSIGWLGRFEAASSLAIPFYCGEELAGALAVATRERIEADDAVWRLVVDVARALTDMKVE